MRPLPRITHSATALPEHFTGTAAGTSPSAPSRTLLRALIVLTSLLVMVLGLPATVPAATARPTAPLAPIGAADEALLARERGSWDSPTGSEPKVAKDFQPPAKRWLSGHRGVDLTVQLSGQIRAPADGTISHVGTVVDRSTITVDHGNGLRSSFEPVESDLKRGDKVRKGQVIGTLANGDHCFFSVRACVHWGVRLGDEYVNPLQFVGAFLPSVLLPVPD